MSSIRTRVGSLAITFLMGLAVWSSNGRGNEPGRITIKRCTAVDPVGDASVKVELSMPAEDYGRAKANQPSAAGVLRRLGLGAPWADVENLRSKFEDHARTVVIEYTQRGLARLTGDDTWEIAWDGDERPDLLAAFDGTGVLSATRETDLGWATLNVRIEGPKGARDVRLEHGPERVTYRLAAPGTQGGEAHAAFRLAAKEKVMSALGSSAGGARLAGLWAARSVFKNTGEQALVDYRVRFRMPGYASTSPWMRSKRVLPGQTVVDVFYPVFDVEKISRATGARPAMVEAEYEYRRADGRVVRDTDSRPVQLLGRNQAMFSSLPDDAAAGFWDKYDNGPILLAALVAGSDPVMQELAGRLRQATGRAAMPKDEDVLEFIVAAYTFLATNKVGLQTPSRHEVKYGRDVIRSRAGTCTDLAVLLGSVCEAAGLKPVLYLVSENCLAGVRLPGGRIVTLDLGQTGSRSFAAAMEEGSKRLQEARAKGQVDEVDVARWRALGVQCLDLPPFETGYLEKNYRFVASLPSVAPGNGTEIQTTLGDTRSIAGRWVLKETGNDRSVEFTLVLAADGKYTYRVVIASAGRTTSDTQESGTFQQEPTILKFTPAEGKRATVYFYRLRADELDLQAEGTVKLVTFRRA